MDADEILKYATSVWGIVMAVSPAMQIRTMLRTGESKDVSVGYFLILIVGFGLWTAYGISIAVPVLWVCNTVATVFGVATVIVALRLRRRIDAS
ncbi:MAG: hypothetical protein JWM90_1977 [Thermoleophilia bacterium]|nr:hypothetical protein [Thermoleophilia bacterium]